MWGDLQSGGPGNWLTASAAWKTTHPQPLPVKEGRNSHKRPPPARPPGRERGESKREDQFSGAPGRCPGWALIKEMVMAHVQVIQRHAHLAGAVKLEFVNGREGKIAKAVLTAISNTRRGSGEAREEESTAIQWTLWGKQAENAAEYLGKGSHVNIVGRLRQQLPGQRRRRRVRAGLHGRRGGLPRQPRRERGAPRQRQATSRPHRAPPAATPRRAARASRPTPEPEPGGPSCIEQRPPVQPHSTIEGKHHVLDPDPGNPLCPQHPRAAHRPAPARRPA